MGKLGSRAVPDLSLALELEKTLQFLFEIIHLDGVSLGFNYKGWCPEPIFSKTEKFEVFFSPPRTFPVFLSNTFLVSPL